MLKDIFSDVHLSVPEPDMYRVFIYSVNAGLVDQLVKEVSNALPDININVDEDSIIDLGEFGKEVQLDKLSNRDRSVGLWLFGFLQTLGWKVEHAVAVDRVGTYTTHIVYHMKREQPSIQT